MLVNLLWSIYVAFNLDREYIDALEEEDYDSISNTLEDDDYERNLGLEDELWVPESD